MPTYQTTPTVTTYRPQVGTPTRKTSEYELDQFNKQLRSSPLYQNFMRQRGLRTDGHVKLSDKQQKELEQSMARAGFPVPKGMHIDQGGNLNQKSTLVRNVVIGAALAAGTIATLGAAGVIGGGVLGTGIGGGAGAGAAGAGAAGTATGVGTGLTTAGVTAPVFGGAGATTLASGVTPVVFGAGGTAAGIGAGVTPAVVGGGAAATGLGAATAGGSVAAPILSNTARTGMASGLGTKDWIDIGSRVWDAGSGIAANRAASSASDKAADLTAKSNAELMALEREKEARRQYEWDTAEAAKQRNFKIEQEEKLEELRRLDEKEAQNEPARLAREATYRAYMKKYWNIDVAPSVARTPRQIAAANQGAATTGEAPVSNKMPIDWSPSPLARLAVPGTGYGSFVSDGGTTAQYATPTPPPPSIALAEDPRYITPSAARRQRFADEGSTI